MIPKIDRRKPGSNGVFWAHPMEFSQEVRDFLIAHSGKRISVVFTGAFRKRLCKVSVFFMQPNCGCCSDHFIFER